MFKRSTTPTDTPQPVQAVERITSVLGSGIVWHGSINGSGGIRIEGAFEGEIALRGMLVVGETGRVTCQNVRANTVIVAGAVRGNITTQKLEIRASGRVWGDVVTTAFVTEEGAFLRGQIRMEETVELDLEPAPESSSSEDAQAESFAQLPEPAPIIEATQKIMRKKKTVKS
ncbi:MAG: polymer-forming cytoskeletal protein [Anaerolineales bacterium]|nr:polymer-forming cytoskeletal protein [Anaerolineales bacterium]MDP2777977.1 polymer-forming cytoskeletal protein [Anaerolineales bacterium]